jgi:hypothetical protein
MLSFLRVPAVRIAVLGAAFATAFPALPAKAEGCAPTFMGEKLRSFTVTRQANGGTIWVCYY